MNLPTVQAQVHKKPLLLYLASSQLAIRALVVQEDEGVIKKPVYYISQALKDAETCYPGVKSMCLAIVYASQRLQHYFLAYEIHLMTKSYTIKALPW